MGARFWPVSSPQLQIKTVKRKEYLGGSVSDSFSHLRDVGAQCGGRGSAPGQNRGVLRSTVSAFFSRPLLKVWMELSRAERPPDGGGREEEESGGGGGAGGRGGVGFDPGGNREEEESGREGGAFWEQLLVWLGAAFIGYWFRSSDSTQNFPSFIQNSSNINQTFCYMNEIISCVLDWNMIPGSDPDPEPAQGRSEWPIRSPHKCWTQTEPTHIKMYENVVI